MSFLLKFNFTHCNHIQISRAFSSYRRGARRQQMIEVQNTKTRVGRLASLALRP